MRKTLNFILRDIIQRPSLYLFVFIIIFSIDRHHRLECSVDKENGPFYGDAFEYYSFLPEYFLDFKQVPEQNFHTTKRTIGMAIMYTPAFFVGHWIVEYTNDVDDGYSPPYQWSIRWGSIIYSLLGLFFCRKNLLMFFSETVTAITLACVFFATNLLHYTYAEGEFPHGYLFFLNAAFIFFTLKWIREQKPSYLLLLCFTGGMITLIRPTGVIVFLFPLSYDTGSFEKIWMRIRYAFSNLYVFAGALFLFSLPLAFQALIWKTYQGHYILYSYKDERFFFNDPQILNFLFSFRKGWLVYTPIMIFSLIGILMSWKRLKPFFVFLLIYFSVNVYVLSSWWDWSYGGSFGCRVLVESYAFMCFPFAVFVAWIWKLNEERKFLKYALHGICLLVFYLLIEFNFFQTGQYKYGRINYSGMNYETYKYVFLKTITKDQAKNLDTRFTPPDTEEMKKGKRDH